MPAMNYDRVAHLYDAYVQAEFDISFFLGEARKAQGPAHLYGDYSYAPFEPDKSPFMIWVLRAAPGEMV